MKFAERWDHNVIIPMVTFAERWDHNFTIRIVTFAERANVIRYLMKFAERAKHRERSKARYEPVQNIQVPKCTPAEVKVSTPIPVPCILPLATLPLTTPMTSVI
jgi:hypothetical protein